MENDDLEKNNSSEDFDNLDDNESSVPTDLNQEDINKDVVLNQESSSLKRSNKDIRVYTMPEEFFNKKYQISRAKRLVEVKKEQEVMESKRIIEEKKRMKRIEKENRKAENEKIKRTKIETINAEKLKREYEKRQKLVEENRKKREAELAELKEKEEEKLRKEEEKKLKEIEEKKLKEIQKEKELNKKNIINNISLDNSSKLFDENKKNQKLEKKDNINFREKISSKFIRNKNKSFSDYFSDTVDGDIADLDVKKHINKKIIESSGDTTQKPKIKKSKKENNFLFIFISIFIFIISVIITILITYRNGDWFYYEEEINIDNNDVIYWNDLIEDESSDLKNDELKEDLETENILEEIENKEESEDTDNIIENEDVDQENDNIIDEENNIKSEVSLYYEKCNFFISDINSVMLLDSDFDCLTDKEEIFYGTLDNNPDSDSDSYLDGLEVSYVYDPLTSGKINNNENLKEYKDDINKFSFYYPKSFEFNTIDGNIFRIVPEKNSYEYFEVELLGSFDLSSLGRITKSSKIQQVEAWVSDSSDYVYFELSNGDILRIYYNLEDLYSDNSNINYQASFSLIVRSISIW